MPRRAIPVVTLMQRTVLLTLMCSMLAFAGCVSEPAPGPVEDPIERAVRWGEFDGDGPVPAVGDNVTFFVEPEPTVPVTYVVHFTEGAQTIAKGPNETSPTKLRFDEGGWIQVDAAWEGGNTTGFVPVADQMRLTGTVPALGGTVAIPFEVTNHTTALRVSLSTDNPAFFRAQWAVKDPDGNKLPQSADLAGLYQPNGEAFPVGTFTIEVTNHDAWPTDSEAIARVGRFFHDGGDILVTPPERGSA